MIFAYSIAKPNGKDLRFRMMVIAKLQIPGDNPHRPQDPLQERKGGPTSAERAQTPGCPPAGRRETPEMISRSYALRLFVWRGNKLGQFLDTYSPLGHREGMFLRTGLCDSAWDLHRVVLEVLFASSRTVSTSSTTHFYRMQPHPHIMGLPGIVPRRTPTEYEAAPKL